VGTGSVEGGESHITSRMLAGFYLSIAGIKSLSPYTKYTMTRICRQCKEEKDEGEFVRNRN